MPPAVFSPQEMAFGENGGDFELGLLVEEAKGAKCPGKQIISQSKWQEYPTEKHSELRAGKK